MFLLICKLYICIQNVFGHIFYSTRLHLYQQVWQFEVQKLAYMLILAAGGMIPYLSSVPCAQHYKLEAFIGQQETSVANGAPCELIHRYTPLKKCYQARKLGRLDNVMVLRLIICCSSAWQPT